MGQAPVALDIRSPMDLVYECFVKLGLRYICVLRDGKYAGMVSLPSFSSNPFGVLMMEFC
jgi:chloride channel 3/4/5